MQLEEYLLSYSLSSFKEDLNNAHLAIFAQMHHPMFKTDSDGRDSLIYEKKLFDFFFKGYYSSLKHGELIRPFFHSKKSYALHYWFTGEMNRNLIDLNRSNSEIFEFKDNKININTMALYALFRVLRDKLVEAQVDLSKSGFPKYFKVFNRDSFFKYFVPKIEYMLSKPKLVKGILGKRTHFEYFIKNQDTAIKMAKKLTVEEVLRYCNANNAGVFLRYFKDEKAFRSAAERLYNECEKILKFKIIKKNGYFPEDFSEQLAKYRITVKSCLRYLKYLALMSTIQNRVKRPVEINAALEKKWFHTGYKMLSDAAVKLKWRICTDATFCPGVRSRTYQIRVASSKAIYKPKRRITFNNIEKVFMAAKNSETKNKIAMAFDFAAEYLFKRAEAHAAESSLVENPRELYFAYNTHYSTKQKKFESILEIRYNRNKYKQQLNSFLKNFSEVKRYKNLPYWRSTG
jgi:hypothetical protein